MSRVSFNILGGEYKAFSNLDITHPYTKLAIGETVDILHSSRNWEGTYEILERSDSPNNVAYNLILARVKLHCTIDGHYKQWVGEIKGNDVVCSWGKINMGQQSVTKNFSNKRSASNYLIEKMDEKLKRGYKLK